MVATTVTPLVIGWSSLKERGRSTPLGQGVCDWSVLVPGSVQTNASEGSGSRLDRKVDPRSGLGHDAGSEWRMMCTPGSVLVGGRVLQRPMWTVWRNRGTRLPVIPSPPAGGGMEWYGRSQAGSIRVCRPRHRGGGQTSSDLASWLRRAVVHAGRARQRMCPSRSPQ